MLTHEENELLCRVEGDAPMGQLMRRHWTPVCLIEEVSEPDGAPVKARVFGEDLVVFRDTDGNVGVMDEYCPHRRVSLVYGRNEDCGLRCLYHGWKMDVKGNVIEMVSEPSCSDMTKKVKHKAYETKEWGGFVWFSLNPDVEPLSDYLDPMQQHIAPYHAERMAWVRDITVEWDCNWKTSVDAFNETYHVQGIHPQLQWYLDDVNVQIDCYGRHNRYLIPFATVSPRVALPSAIPPAIHEIMVKAGMDPADYEGRVSDIRRDVQLFKREHGPAQGKDYSELNDDQLTDDYHYMIFPNVSLNVHSDDIMMFRQRPHATDPDKMYYDIWMFELVPQGQPWPERPKHKRFKHGDRSIGQVLDQDAFNLPTVQKGMYSDAFPGLWIGDQELRIRHFHKVIDDHVYPHGKRPGDL